MINMEEFNHVSEQGRAAVQFVVVVAGEEAAVPMELSYSSMPPSVRARPSSRLIALPSLERLIAFLTANLQAVQADPNVGIIGATPIQTST